MAIAWIGAALVLGIIELFSVDMFFLALAISALAAGVGGLFGLPLGAELAIFAGTAVLSLFLIRPWAKRKLARTTPDIETNGRRLVGKTARVTAPLLGTDGRVRLDGEEWSARAEGTGTFPVGSEVRVLAIEGAVAVVGPLDQPVETPSDTAPPQN